MAYKGTRFHGWQKQANAISIQQKIEEALSTIFNKETKITGSGRTDTGVHAMHQVAHFDWTNPLPQELAYKLNSLLPKDIVIKKIYEVKSEAHARFSAKKRTYSYFITTALSPFNHELKYFCRKDLAIDAMNQACKELIGKKNFKCFSKTKTNLQAFKCDVKVAHWKKIEGGLAFYISANRFLRGMVRIIVGTLMDVGEQKTSINDFASIIESKDHQKAGRSVPAHGLYLYEVIYPQNIIV